MHASPMELPVFPEPAVGLPPPDHAVPRTGPLVVDPLSVVEEVLSARGENAPSVTGVISPIALFVGFVFVVSGLPLYFFK